ncbi:cubilin [Harmonia axyridis]|uniref:cubilin n=1 Tax=Harmonia axyridis TaxID=115357 RepID=UPI001E27985D|nr:cubilin [Harmonia axyridis]
MSSILTYIWLISIFIVIDRVIISSANYENELRTFEFGELCDETITEPQFIIESFKYPKAYPPNLDCQLIFKGNNCSAHYKFQFIDFNIEQSSGCVKDRLEVGLLDALCGRKDGIKSYLSHDGILTLRFKTDSNISENGFKILVTRIEECTKDDFDSQRKTILKGNAVGNRVNSNLRECCPGNSQISNRFILKSPNFPVSLSSFNDCVLQIHKSSPDVCRLRIIFQFFWFGNSLDCSEGFLQIDGKIICGCKKDLKLISTFDENVKVLRFRSAGIIKNSYSGFRAEVFQDNCPKKLKTDLIAINNSNISEQLEEKRDPKLFGSFTSKRDEGSIYRNTRDNIVGHEREQRDFLTTEEIDGVLRNNVDNFQECLKWNQAQFENIFHDSKIKLDQCENVQRNTNDEKKCLGFSDIRGFLFSPGYPFFYPGQLRMCYRFNRLPKSCGVRVHFFDFRIDHSEFCSKDRLEIEGRSYCGVALWSKSVVLDLRNKNFVDFNFITSTPKCALGFKAYYEYLPCEEVVTENPFPRPITKIFPVPPSTTFRPNQKCGGVVREEMFTLTEERGSRECVFIIEKFIEYVCQIVLKFEKFPIDCSEEVIKINGKSYCGNPVETVIIGGEDFPVEVVYLKFGPDGNGFKIKGVQDATNCRLPPAQLTK